MMLWRRRTLNVPRIARLASLDEDVPTKKRGQQVANARKYPRRAHVLDLKPARCQQVANSIKGEVVQVPTIPTLFLACNGQTTEHDIEPPWQPYQVGNLHDELSNGAQYAVDFCHAVVRVKDV